MNVEAKLLYRGDAYTICEILRSGKGMIEGFVRQLSREQRAGILALIRRIADHGPPSNTARFRYEGDRIYAIKDGQVRIYCFFDKGALILLTNGAVKKTRKADPKDLEIAVKLRKAYMEARR